MITRYEPFHEALSLRRAMDQLLEQSFVNPGSQSSSPSLIAPMDICETPNGYEVDVALPGVRSEDIELTIDQNTLTLRGHFSQQNEHEHQGQSQAQQQNQPQGAQHNGEQQTQQSQQGETQRHRQGHNWLSREIVSGAFERTVTFPRPIDSNNIQTKLENGILTITLPVNEASLPRRISLTGNQGQPQQVSVAAGQKQSN